MRRPTASPPQRWSAAAFVMSGVPARRWWARLLRACLDRGVVPRTGAAAREVLMHDGRISGSNRRDGPFGVAVRGSVVLATGGFEWNADLVRQLRAYPADPSGVRLHQYR